MTEHVYLDFDRTLFDSERYLQWLDRYFAEHYGLASTAFSISVGEFYQDVEGHGLYQPDDHIQYLVGVSWAEVAESIKKFANETGTHFCFTETHDFLQQLSELSPKTLRLLTFGDEGNQLHKINLCPEIARMQCVTVDRPKREFLAQHHMDESGVLVDDKTDLRLPNNWRHIWINRTGAQAAGHDVEVHDLIESLEHIM